MASYTRKDTILAIFFRQLQWRIKRARVQDDKLLRDAAIREAYLEHRHSMALVARHAGVHFSTVSKIIKGDR